MIKMKPYDVLALYLFLAFLSFAVFTDSWWPVIGTVIGFGLGTLISYRHNKSSEEPPK